MVMGWMGVEERQQEPGEATRGKGKVKEKETGKGEWSSLADSQRKRMKTCCESRTTVSCFSLSSIARSIITLIRFAHLQAIKGGTKGEDGQLTPQIWQAYKASQASFWTAEEIDLGQDMGDWNDRLTENERFFILRELTIGLAASSEVATSLRS